MSPLALDRSSSPAHTGNADFWSITRNLCQLLVKFFDWQIVHGEVGVVVCCRARRSQEQRQNPLLRALLGVGWGSQARKPRQSP